MVDAPPENIFQVLHEVAWRGIRLERDVAAGAVHATLERLEKKGLVSSRLGSGTPVRDGRARRFYRMQPAGLHALNEARAAVNNLWHGLKWPLKDLHYDNA